ncbi:CapA family protein [Hamadaea tsunoensis]|uniref:CapA family protein n=1 Tax=Hamadaea tsunoensis TaxID=53368 RepID=UPI0003F7244F|nr:CapA family protein [Hamadaea tsunoensis]
MPGNRRLLAPSLVAVLLAAALAGCTARAAAPTGAPTAPATPSPARPITVAFAGDVHFTDRTSGVLDQGMPGVTALMGGADLAMVNLETAVTSGGTPEPKQFHFRAPAGAFAALKAAGIDVTTIANNHALDYGRAGLTDTLAAAAQARMPVVGAGPTAGAAFAPQIFTIRGTRIAVLGMSQVSELWQAWRATDTRSGLAMARDTDRAVAAVRAAKKRADVVIVYLHWGTEYQECPSAEQRDLARRLSDAGADALVGTHAHVLLGDGWLRHTYVHYGLSNFVWWRNDAATNDTEVLTLTIRSGRIISGTVTPAYIDRTTGVPAAVSGAAAQRILAERRRVVGCSGLSAAPVAE